MWTKRDEDRGPSVGAYPTGYRAAVYKSGLDKASLRPPIWQCSHSHASPLDAEECGQEYVHNELKTTTDIDRMLEDYR
jgi:hypothetical protein